MCELAAEIAIPAGASERERAPLGDREIFAAEGKFARDATGGCD
jgi:hypothetical protein